MYTAAYQVALLLVGVLEKQNLPVGLKYGIFLGARKLQHTLKVISLYGRVIKKAASTNGIIANS